MSGPPGPLYQAAVSAVIHLEKDGDVIVSRETLQHPIVLPWTWAKFLREFKMEDDEALRFSKHLSQLLRHEKTEHGRTARFEIPSNGFVSILTILRVIRERYPFTTIEHIVVGFHVLLLLFVVCIVLLFVVMFLLLFVCFH